MRPARLILALLIAVGLLPPVWLRDPPPSGKASRIGAIIALDHRGARAGPFVLAGAWRIDGDPKMFGGFSALAALSGDRLIAASDGGKKIVFTRPDIGGPPPVLSPFGPETDVNKIGADLESLTRDPESGMLWAAYEFSQSIRRFTPELVDDGAIRPAAMRDWGDNSGAEAFARLRTAASSPSRRERGNSAVMLIERSFSRAIRSQVGGPRPSGSGCPAAIARSI
jgi:hypothetical protein